MRSWGGTSKVTVLKPTLTILSAIGISMKRPGPLARPCTLPSLKMTPPLVLLNYLDGARQDEQDNRNHRYQHEGRKPYSNRLQQAQARVHERHSFRLNLFRPSCSGASLPR